MQKLIIQGDNPKNRFGHSLTLIIKSKAILFGGAIGDSTQYSITNDTYSLDLLSLNWKKLNPQGKKPTARAAHAACSIGLYHLLIFGGATGGGGLSSDDLFILDMKKGDDHSVWSQIFPEGTSPGPRYGHSIILMKQSVYLFGGNSGTESLNDFWCLNLESVPYIWTKIVINSSSDSPSPRAYHAASICHSGFAKGMILIHGGRDNSQKALNDTWGLIKHRNGNWDWIKAPHENSKDVTPSSRYQVNPIIFFIL